MTDTHGMIKKSAEMLMPSIVLASMRAIQITESALTEAGGVSPADQETAKLAAERYGVFEALHQGAGVNSHLGDHEHHSQINNVYHVMHGHARRALQDALNTALAPRMRGEKRALKIASIIGVIQSNVASALTDPNPRDAISDMIRQQDRGTAREA